MTRPTGKVSIGKTPKKTSDAPPNIVSPAINIAVLSIIAGGLCGGIEEEATTGALLGAIACNMEWLTHLYVKKNESEGSKADQTSLCNLVIYQKKGGATSSEAWTGSDFAILIKISENKYRAAIFQAKRMEKCGSFLAIQLSPGNEHCLPEPQIVRQLRYAQNYKGQPSSEIEEIEKIDWIHLLFYREDSIAYSSLSTLSTLCSAIVKHNENFYLNESKAFVRTDTLKDRVKNHWKGYNDRTYTPQHLHSFSELIITGVETSSEGEAKGWRSIEGKDVDAFIKETEPEIALIKIANEVAYNPVIANNNSVKSARTSLSSLIDQHIISSLEMKTSTPT